MEIYPLLLQSVQIIVAIPRG